MVHIRIQERSVEADEFKVVVSFNHGTEYAIAVKKPFSNEEEDRLEWYFERYLRFPFTDQVKAEEAADSVTTYGESLFKQIFGENSKANFPYRTAVQSGLNGGQIE